MVIFGKVQCLANEQSQLDLSEDDDKKSNGPSEPPLKYHDMDRSPSPDPIEQGQEAFEPSENPDSADELSHGASANGSKDSDKNDEKSSKDGDKKSNCSFQKPKRTRRSKKVVVDTTK